MGSASVVPTKHPQRESSRFRKTTERCITVLDDVGCSSTGTKSRWHAALRGPDTHDLFYSSGGSKGYPTLSHTIPHSHQYHQHIHTQTFRGTASHSCLFRPGVGHEESVLVFKKLQSHLYPFVVFGIVEMSFPEKRKMPFSFVLRIFVLELLTRKIIPVLQFIYNKL